MESQKDSSTKTTAINLDISNEILNNIKDTDELLAESKKEQDLKDIEHIDKTNKQKEKVIYDNNLPDSQKYKKQEKIKYTTHKINPKTKLCEKKVYDLHIDHFKQYKREAIRRSNPRNALCLCSSIIIITSIIASMIYTTVSVPELWWVWMTIMSSVVAASLLLTYLLVKMNISIELENVVTDSELQKKVESSHEV